MLRSKIHILLIVYLFSSAFAGFAQGLCFNGRNVPIDRRTSYEVFHDQKQPQFRDSLHIEFDMRLYPEKFFGYLLRLTNNDKTYTLTYNGQDVNGYFIQLCEEGAQSLITIKVNRQELLRAGWFPVSILFNAAENRIALSVSGEKRSVKCDNIDTIFRPNIVFGKSQHYIDVPKFAIRNLRIGSDQESYFPLDQSSGEQVYNHSGKAIGSTVNPIWLINDSYHWQHKVSYKSAEVAGASFNTIQNQLYYYNRDTIWRYDLNEESEMPLVKFEEQCPVRLKLGMNFIASGQDKLYTYETFDPDYPNLPMVASLDLSSYKWNVESYSHLSKLRHHHASYFNDEEQSFIIFGGFGDMSYSDSFDQYNTAKRAWSQIDNVVGDQAPHRYFSSMGYDGKKNALYIFGGMGNDTGEQSIGRLYYYDLHRLDLNTNKLTKLWDIEWQGVNTVPVRSMVISEDGNCFYTLCYSESTSNSQLHLYEFSIKDGEHRILGDSIPIHSDKIATNANLYHDSIQDKLVATVQVFDYNDIGSTLDIYTINFPPITEGELIKYNRVENTTRQITSLRRLIIVIIHIILAFILALYFVIRHRRKSRVTSSIIDNTAIPPYANEDIASRNIPHPNSIYLFGGFTARDRNNRDITHLFSQQQKQILLLIMEYHTQGGVSSQHINKQMWPLKTKELAKNSRGVVISLLRKTLKEFDNIEVLYSNGKFSLRFLAPFYCDYIHCMELISKGKAKYENSEFLNIIKRGKFLELDECSTLDRFKEVTEGQLETVLLNEIGAHLIANDHLTVIELSQLLLDTDPLNEVAIGYIVKSYIALKNNDEALHKYTEFALEYKRCLNRQYPRSFKDLTL